MTTAIIDYGSGNLHSAHEGLRTRRARSRAMSAATFSSPTIPTSCARAERVVLPGVGAFADCRRGLLAIAGMDAALNEAVIDNGRPFLGICVGMQLMATRGLEHGETRGLGLDRRRRRRDRTRRSVAQNPAYGMEHPDASRARTRCSPASQRARKGLHAYFVHSYHLTPRSREDLLATTDYGAPLTAAVARDNLVGVQFHPEKSQRLGLALIANFLRWRP